MTRRRRQRGFILLAALAVLAIVAVAILTLAAASVYDGKRTFDRARHAQLDQMLLAGASEAAEHLKHSAPKEGEFWEVDLPSALAEQHASLVTTIDSANVDQIVLKIHAQIEN